MKSIPLHLAQRGGPMTKRVCVYMTSRILDILKKISDKEKLTMSCILRVAFIDKFSKFYPDLFSIQDKKIKEASK